ncbi:NUDIX domain-containing protein [Brevundimonas goettingensis]|uniref:ADP-ribose pyrophosphatase n=1 Tax=Brevundimonas goettingensis TaxID=2774190 RepID=A0A975C1N2_9CAUL|nr:NUDIX hydrolase [Brevundimonas goettingensis]QTC90150.1 NUDIX hydrolase [Brevundimonas goettingensis]
MGRLISKTPLYRGRSILYQAEIELDSGVVVQREIEAHGQVVAVLTYDPERRTALLVRQMRGGPLVDGAADGHLLEVIAGMIDAGESEETAARREAMEEVGITLGALDRIGAAWSSPGVSTERMTLYLGAFSTSDRTASGGGLADENEEIEAVEIPLSDLARLQDEDALQDLKTLALLSALRLRRPELF